MGAKGRIQSKKKKVCKNTYLGLEVINAFGDESDFASEARQQDEIKKS